MACAAQSVWVRLRGRRVAPMFGASRPETPHAVSPVSCARDPVVLTMARRGSGHTNDAASVVCSDMQ
jgi:hypothetical protein